MPWPTNHLPKYRKHRASGQACITLRGRDFYLGPYGSKASRVLYDRLIGEFLQSGRSLQSSGGAELTIVELAARYLKFAQAYYVKDGRPTGVTAAIKCAIGYACEWYGRELAIDFGPLSLKSVRQRMVEVRLSRRYVNDLVGWLKSMFKWGAGEQLVPVAIHQSLAIVPGLTRGRTVARETDRVLPVQDATVEATLPHPSLRGLSAASSVNQSSLNAVIP